MNVTKKLHNTCLWQYGNKIPLVAMFGPYQNKVACKSNYCDCKYWLISVLLPDILYQNCIGLNWNQLIIFSKVWLLKIRKIIKLLGSKTQRWALSAYLKLGF